MKKTIFGTVLAVGLAVTTMGPVSAADMSVTESSTADVATTVASATISGSVGERQTDGSSLRLRYVGDPAPEGYDGNYQRGEAITVPSPEDAPVTMMGTLDLSGMSENGQTAVIGLHDAEALANGATGHKQEVGIYVTYRTGSDGYYDIGVTDGDAGGGEWVQSFQRVTVSDLPDGIVNVEFTVDGDADPATCASDSVDVTTADGCMSLTINGGAEISDSYGSIRPAGVETELGNGAHPGWYAAWTTTGPEIGVLYDLAISPVVQAPLESKDQCKDGGFAAYDFKNQGQCIASLSRTARHTNSRT